MNNYSLIFIWVIEVLIVAMILLFTANSFDKSELVSIWFFGMLTFITKSVWYFALRHSKLEDE